MALTRILVLVLCGLVVAGLATLRLEVDVFDLLPRDSPMVDGLRLYQEGFAAPRGLVLSLRAADPATTERAAGNLAEDLTAAGLTPHVIRRNPFTDDPGSVAELLAYLWLNRPPEDFSQLGDRFADDRLAARLDEVIERLATSIRPREVARLARDPFSLSAVADRVSSPLGSSSDDPFVSGDGTFRILFVLQPFEGADFWRHRDWTSRIGDRIDAWRRGADPDLAAVTVRMTGNPAFVAENGAGLLRDARGAAVGTLVLIAGLFWLVHRRWLPLVWLVVLLVAILAATAALGGFLLGGRLNAMSLGFAAILLGLAADYALILYQDLVAYPRRELGEHRSAMAPSILWAAATTAGAFFMIGRSSLPGLIQLGTLVGVGTLLAAVVMLLAFLPPLVGHIRGEPARRLGLGGFLPSRRAVGWITLLLAFGSCGVLVRGLPGVEVDTEQLGSRESEARDALDEIRREIGGFDNGLWLLVEGRDERAVADRLDRDREALDRAVAEGVLAGYFVPDGLWPRPANQEANRDRARRLAGRLEAVRAAAAEAGFNDEALGLTAGVFAAWKSLAEGDGVIWPERPGIDWAFRQFAARRPGRTVLALGRLQAAPGATDADLAALAGRFGDGSRIFSWALLADSLLGNMERDVRRVLLPMGVLLVVLLGLAFRRPGEVFLSLFTLGFSLLCLLAVMVALGWSWNLMNVMSLPLLFGAGVDYSIHVQLALKSHGGDTRRVRKTVGRAILLCGASTAAGFGTLAFASNAGLATLGQVCAAGIVLISLISVLLLPSWWGILHRRPPARQT